MPTPPKSLDDMPLAAYGGTGMQEAPGLEPESDASMAAMAAAPADAAHAGSAATSAMAAPGATPAAEPDAAVMDALPVPEDEPSHGPSPLSRVPVARIIQTLRTSRVAAGAGFAVVIVVGIVLLSGGGASPAATAATPSKGPTAAPTIVPPSGDVSMTLAGAATGSFNLAGLSGGQEVTGGAVMLAWADTLQTTLSIAGPIDRGTRATDERLVLTLGVVVKGVPVMFTSKARECTIGMAAVGAGVQGSFTCHRLKSPDGKLAIDASGTYHS
jgi:hypothetical protein